MAIVVFPYLEIGAFGTEDESFETPSSSSAAGQVEGTGDGFSRQVDEAEASEAPVNAASIAVLRFAWQKMCFVSLTKSP